ncbi:MAG: restriction endonuclease subunit S [Defluviitaleaceae bacterium]|nr:restriction endonuclease subunit S [Defluviitaleaceae bacterium]
MPNFRKFCIGELFDISTPKRKFNANTVKFGGKYRYVARGESNNGIRGYITESEQYLNPANTISFGQDTATMFYQNMPYFTGDKIKIFTLKDKVLTREIAIYLITAMKKAFAAFAWGRTSFKVAILESVAVYLPVTAKGEIDFLFMEKRIRELVAYLKVTGLTDYKLTTDEEQFLTNYHKFTGGARAYKPFRLGDLFEKVSTKHVHKNHADKKNSVSEERTNEHSIYLTCAKQGNNGIMYYGKPEEWENHKNVISVIQDGAVAAGRIYAHRYSSGTFSHSHMIKIKSENVSHEVNLFLTAVIEKVTYPKYTRDNIAIWDRVCEDTIYLPSTSDDKPDYEYMATFVRVQQKLAIKNLVEQKDKELEIYKAITTA